jgi:pimeloyl-ACP methyl ester carboxylesterase
VVLLHGYAETGYRWHPIMLLLAERHTVVVPDLRDTGGSAKPASETTPQTSRRKQLHPIAIRSPRENNRDNGRWGPAGRSRIGCYWTNS